MIFDNKPPQYMTSAELEDAIHVTVTIPRSYFRKHGNVKLSCQTVPLQTELSSRSAADKEGLGRLDRPGLGQKQPYLSSMAENTNNDMFDTAANTYLQIYYDNMWDRAFSAVACEDLHYDTQLTVGSDLRRGLTLIARPNQALRGRFDAVLDRLSDIEPQQYRHPASICT
jgi:hypothetical protein